MSVDRPQTDSRFCLATVTTDSFAPGTMVTLHSFLNHNRWFDGDIVLIHDQLTEEYRQRLSQIYDRIRFLQVSSQLLSRVRDVVKIVPEFGHKQARFYSLETFRLRDWDKVLFCDSDLLFRQSVRDLFEMPQPLIACGDAAHYQGRGRDWLPDFNGGNQEGNRDRVHNTFNSGLFLVDLSLLTDERYKELIELVDSRIYRSTIRQTDQVILNLCFAGHQHLVSGTYNYLLAHRAAIYEREGVSLTDARVIHFNGRKKPWMARDVMFTTQADPAFIKACEFWFAGYIACLQELYLRQQPTQRANQSAEE